MEKPLVVIIAITSFGIGAPASFSAAFGEVAAVWDRARCAGVSISV
jgi:hypothetical protein